MDNHRWLKGFALQRKEAYSHIVGAQSAGHLFNGPSWDFNEHNLEDHDGKVQGIIAFGTGRMLQRRTKSIVDII